MVYSLYGIKGRSVVEVFFFFVFALSPTCDISLWSRRNVRLEPCHAGDQIRGAKINL